MATASWYLDSLLAPLAADLARADVTDIWINRPCEVWTETVTGGIERRDAPELDGRTLARLARQIAAASAQGISREHPLLAATLADGSRVQVVAPPATRGAHALAIRRHVTRDLGIADFVVGEGVQSPSGSAGQPLEEVGHSDIPLGEAPAYLQNAVRARRNILVSGGTSSGKTTFLNALLREIPRDERLILIEDTPELELVHANAVGLVAARSALGEAEVVAEDLLIAALRMRPDRIILGELRGTEAFTFLRAVNTGHPGSMTTIHADSPERAIDQLALLVLQSGARLAWDDVRRYVRASVDVFVQLDRVAGKRGIARVLGRG